MAQQTAMKALVEQMKINDIYKPCMPYLMEIIDEVYLPMEKEQRIRDYNAGYTDAQCNHVNDAENYANEIEYLKAKIDDIDDEIKCREHKIASLLINRTTDHDITDYIISPFGTPEKK